MWLVVNEIVEPIRKSVDSFDKVRAKRVECGIEDQRVVDDRLLPEKGVQELDAGREEVLLQL